MSVCFIANGDIGNAGARMRAYWPAQFIPDATVVTWADVAADKLPTADTYVFQKLVDVALMQRLRAGGALVFWDVCDPVWWFNPTDAQEAAAAADGIVASSSELSDDFWDWSGRKTFVIPDRVLLSHFDRRRVHEYTDRVRLIWYGAAQNRIALFAAVANLSRLRANGHDIALTLADDMPEMPATWLENELPVYYTRWSLSNEVEVLTAHDIALLPPYPGPWGRVKSNNKKVTARAAGLPVVGDNYDYLLALVDNVELRKKDAVSGRKRVERYYNVEQSATDWLALIEENTTWRN